MKNPIGTGHGRDSQDNLRRRSVETSRNSRKWAGHHHTFVVSSNGIASLLAWNGTMTDLYFALTTRDTSLFRFCHVRPNTPCIDKVTP